eukprot:4954893-Pleurochrysis_carterae.AAC.1
MCTSHIRLRDMKLGLELPHDVCLVGFVFSIFSSSCPLVQTPLPTPAQVSAMVLQQLKADAE